MKKWYAILFISLLSLLFFYHASGFCEYQQVPRYGYRMGPLYMLQGINVAGLVVSWFIVLVIVILALGIFLLSLTWILVKSKAKKKLLLLLVLLLPLGLVFVQSYDRANTEEVITPDMRVEVPVYTDYVINEKERKITLSSYWGLPTVTFSAPPDVLHKLQGNEAPVIFLFRNNRLLNTSSVNVVYAFGEGRNMICILSGFDDIIKYIK